ncbi:hypothetical protein BD779DRAFT_1492273 [Infundibulicybe gibba]|nr:hypothetical protein BD779DRAFT_1492273 [Infundibulicybe gibba]
MEDDIIFGASVWGATDAIDPVISPPKSPHPAATHPAPSEATTDDDQFYDFDDFESSVHTTRTDVDDDDFGDFGDFDEGETVTPTAFGGFVEEASVAGPSSHREWHSLHLEPFPPRLELEYQVDEIISPIWGNDDMHSVSTEGIREVEGISQVLVTPESRDLYKTLIKTPPPMKPPNWTLSRIRRQHLITLGIPVNLDEVLPRANGNPMPPLEISTRPMSAPPGPRGAAHPPHGSTTNAQNSRSGTPQPNKPPARFGPKPELDQAKIKSLLDLDLETLTIQPLAILERHLTDLRAQTAETSLLLTHLLQARDTLQQDSETYNGLIAELVGEAQKKSAKARVIGKRGSGMT